MEKGQEPLSRLSQPVVAVTTSTTLRTLNNFADSKTSVPRASRPGESDTVHLDVLCISGLWMSESRENGSDPKRRTRAMIWSFLQERFPLQSLLPRSTRSEMAKAAMMENRVLERRSESKIRDQVVLLAQPTGTLVGGEDPDQLVARCAA